MLLLSSPPIIPGAIRPNVITYLDAKKYLATFLEEPVTFTAPYYSLSGDVAQDVTDYTLSGNTISQLADNGVSYVNWTVLGAGTTKGANGIHLVADASNDGARLTVTVKPSTTYTFVYFVRATDLDNNFVFTTSGFVSTTVVLSKTLGLNKIVVTTKADVTGANMIYLGLAVSNTDGKYIDFTDVMLFEGDQTANPLTSRYIAYGTQPAGDTTLTSVGVNRFDKTKANRYDNYYKNDSGGISGPDATTGYTRGFYPIEGNQACVISGSPAIRVYFYDSGQNWISRSATVTTFTTPANCRYFDLQYNPSTVNIDTLQVEKGSVATAYQPYTGTTQTITAVGTRVGSVADEWSNGVRTKRNNGVILNGSLSWDSLNATDTNTYRIRLLNWATNNNALINQNNTAFATSLDGNYQSISTSTTGGAYDFRSVCCHVDGSLYLRTEKTKVDAQAGADTTAKFKAYLNLYPIDLRYQLASPIVTDSEKVLQASDIVGLITTSGVYDRVTITKPADYIGKGNTNPINGNAKLDISLGDKTYVADDAQMIGYIASSGTTQISYMVAKGTYANLATAQTALTGAMLFYKLATGIAPTPKPITVYPNGTVFIDSSTGVLPDVTLEAKYKYWNDYSGKGRHMRANNLAYTTGSNLDVNALTLDGIDDYGSFANNTPFDITTAPLAIFATISVAVGAGQGYIVCKNLSSAADVQYAMFYENTGKDIGINLNGTVYFFNTVLTEGTTYDVGFIWIGSTLKRFLNGVQLGTDLAYSTPLTSRPTLAIGKQGAGSLYFKGNIKNLAIYAGAGVTEAYILKERKNTMRRYGG